MCNGNIKGKGKPDQTANKGSKDQQREPQCHLVHHSNPYLNIGPFHIEVKFYSPFRTILHDFFTEREMKWLMDYSKPRLSASREGHIPQSTKDLTKAMLRYMNPRTTGRTVVKAVTVWLKDIEYPNREIWNQINKNGQPLKYEITPASQDPYAYIVHHKVLYDISKRIELATYLNVTVRYGASLYQTTNYGLSGMVGSHMDPWGYETGVELSEERKELVRTGDYMATFMGWFANTEAGGGTAFMDHQYEGTMRPTKGSAAFWFNLAACHEKDGRTQHAGCPVLKGSKWILNKWINSWEQWKSWPCYLDQHKNIYPFEGMSS